MGCEARLVMTTAGSSKSWIITTLARWIIPGGNIGGTAAIALRRFKRTTILAATQWRTAAATDSVTMMKGSSSKLGITRPIPPTQEMGTRATTTSTLTRWAI